MTPSGLQAKQGAKKGNSKDIGSNSLGLNPVEHREDSGSTTDDSDFEVQPSRFTNPSRADAFNTAQAPQQARADVIRQILDAPIRRRELVSRPNLSSKDIVTASSSEEDGMETDNQVIVTSELGLDDETRNTAAESKPRIGKIGGKTNMNTERGKPAVASPTRVTGPMITQVNIEPVSDRTKQRRGTLKASEPVRIGRPTVQTRSPSPMRETSQERANRKREQLKRELESKGQASAKKKRKF